MIEPIASKALPSKKNDKRFVLTLAGSILALIALVTLIAPNHDENDPRPTTYNSGTAGAKAAFLLLQDLGYKASRWEQPTTGLRDVDAAHTTLVLADPLVPFEQRQEVQADIAAFLAHGGRILMTGPQGLFLVPGAEIKRSTRLINGLCDTTPEGQGRLARIGRISLPDNGSWVEKGVHTTVQQRCGDDAVVVEHHVGAGEVIWWTSAQPLTNQGLKADASLKLLLASLGGTDRHILFDEGLEGFGTPLWETAKGLPIWALWLQAGFVAVLLILSYGRRSGPLRTPIRPIRTSPLEFAESMGHLYQKAGATQVATEGARQRLLRFLHDRCGISQAVLRESPATVADAIRQRLGGGEWSNLSSHLTQAAHSEYAALSAKSALALVRELDADRERMQQAMNPRKP